MLRLAPVLAALLLAMALNPARPQDAKEPKKDLPAGLAELAKLSTDDMLKQYDKNKDGALSREEAPPFLSKGFERADRNSDGKLDRTEIDQTLQFIRTMAAQGKTPPEADKLVGFLLQQFDGNKDEKIAKDEARGKMADNFATLDANKDGFLDRTELRQLAARMAGFQPKGGPFPGKGPFAGGGLDFDALDKDADGRLNADEIRNSPLASRLAEIDANNDGRVDRQEFEAFQRRQAAKKD